MQTTAHALQEDPGRVAAQNQYNQWVQEIDERIWANRKRLVEDPQFRSTIKPDLVAKALTEMIRDGQMSLQQIQQTITAQHASSQRPGDPAGPTVASVSSSPSQIPVKEVKFKVVCPGDQDAEVQTDWQADLGFTGCHLISGDLLTTQKGCSMQHAEVQTDCEVDLGFTGCHLIASGGDLMATQTEAEAKLTKTQARNLRRRKIIKKWKDSTKADGEQ